MNGFWVGLLVFPVAVGSLALAVGAVMWAANRWRVWTEESTARLQKARLPEAFSFSPGNDSGTMADLQGREFIAEAILTSRSARLINLSAQTGIIIVSGGTDFSLEETRVFTKALRAAVQELGLAHSRKVQGLDKAESEPEAAGPDGPGTTPPDEDAEAAPEKA